jgi:hypothetical protein
VVVEELKERLTAQAAAKLKRYEDRQNQYLQSGVFETSQKMFERWNAWRETMLYRLKRVENYGMVSLIKLYFYSTNGLHLL